MRERTRNKTKGPKQRHLWEVPTKVVINHLLEPGSTLPHYVCILCLPRID